MNKCVFNTIFASNTFNIYIYRQEGAVSLTNHLRAVADPFYLLRTHQYY